MFRQFIRDESGATAVEYGLIVAVLSLAIVAGVASVANGINHIFVSSASALK